jgi:hypothetical protein
LQTDIWICSVVNPHAGSVWYYRDFPHWHLSPHALQVVFKWNCTMYLGWRWPATYTSNSHINFNILHSYSPIDLIGQAFLGIYKTESSKPHNYASKLQKACKNLSCWQRLS